MSASQRAGASRKGDTRKDRRAAEMAFARADAWARSAPGTKYGSVGVKLPEAEKKDKLTVGTTTA